MSPKKGKPSGWFFGNGGNITVARGVVSRVQACRNEIIAKLEILS